MLISYKLHAGVLVNERDGRVVRYVMTLIGSCVSAERNGSPEGRRDAAYPWNSEHMSTKLTFARPPAGSVCQARSLINNELQF